MCVARYTRVCVCRSVCMCACAFLVLDQDLALPIASTTSFLNNSRVGQCTISLPDGDIKSMRTFLVQFELRCFYLHGTPGGWRQKLGIT